MAIRKAGSSDFFDRIRGVDLGGYGMNDSQQNFLRKVMSYGPTSPDDEEMYKFPNYRDKGIQEVAKAPWEKPYTHKSGSVNLKDIDPSDNSSNYMISDFQLEGGLKEKMDDFYQPGDMETAREGYRRGERLGGRISSNDKGLQV